MQNNQHKVVYVTKVKEFIHGCDSDSKQKVIKCDSLSLSHGLRFDSLARCPKRALTSKCNDKSKRFVAQLSFGHWHKTRDCFG